MTKRPPFSENEKRRLKPSDLRRKLALGYQNLQPLLDWILRIGHRVHLVWLSPATSQRGGNDRPRKQPRMGLAPLRPCRRHHPPISLRQEPNCQRKLQATCPQASVETRPPAAVPTPLLLLCHVTRALAEMCPTDGVPVRIPAATAPLRTGSRLGSQIQCAAAQSPASVVNRLPTAQDFRKRVPAPLCQETLRFRQHRIVLEPPHQLLRLGSTCPCT